MNVSGVYSNAVCSSAKHLLKSKIPGVTVSNYSLASNEPAVKAAKNGITRFLSFLQKAGIDLTSGGGSVMLKNGNIINYIGRGKNLNIFMTKPDGRELVSLVKNNGTTQLTTKGKSLLFDNSSLWKTVKN